MTKRKHSNKNSPHARIKKSRANVYIISILFLSLVILLAVLAKTLISTTSFLIKHIDVQGQHPHIAQEKLRQTLSPYLNINFFMLDTAQLREHLLDFPWVSEVKITRVWPDKLIVHIIEQKPVAIWNSKELMNEEGEVFEPPRSTFPPNLPELFGITGQQLSALDAYRKLSEMLKPWHLAPSMILFSPDQTFVVVLTNGMQVKLGNDNMYAHFRHFLQVYNELFLNKEDKVEYVDISYPNGMAVKWKS